MTAKAARRPNQYGKMEPKSCSRAESIAIKAGLENLKSKLPPGPLPVPPQNAYQSSSAMAAAGLVKVRDEGMRDGYRKAEREWSAARAAVTEEILKVVVGLRPAEPPAKLAHGLLYQFGDALLWFVGGSALVLYGSLLLGVCISASIITGIETWRIVKPLADAAIAR